MIENKKTGVTMEKITIDGKDFEVSDEVATAYGKESEKITAERLDEIDKLEIEVKTEKAVSAELKTRLDSDDDTLQAKLDVSAEALKVATEKVSGYEAKEQTVRLDSVITSAKRILPEDFDFTGKTEKDIRLDSVKHYYQKSDINFDEKSDSYVEAMLDQTLIRLDQSDVVGKELGDSIINGRRLDSKTDGDKVEEAKNKYIARLTNQGEGDES